MKRILILTFALLSASIVLAAPDLKAGLGVWIWEMNKCEGGDIDAIIAKAKAAHLGHVLIRVTSNGDRWAKFNSKAKVYELAKGLRSAGIRVYAWGYNYPFDASPDRSDRQIELVKALVADPAFDGYVYNVETEFANRRVAAERLMRPVKEHRDEKYPNKFLGYSTYCRIDKGRGAQMPILEFNRWCDVAMPQAYWRTFDWPPRRAAVRMCSTWLEKEQAWQKQGIANVARPLFPTAHAYNGKGVTEYITPNELANFLDATDGYFGVNVWSWQHMAPEHWEVLKVGAIAWIKAHPGTSAVQAKPKATAKVEQKVQAKPNPPAEPSQPHVVEETSETDHVSWWSVFIQVVTGVWLATCLVRSNNLIAARAAKSSITSAPLVKLLATLVGALMLVVSDLLTAIAWLVSKLTGQPTGG